ncbi:MAG: extensin family protein [Thermaurantiacus sp.]
MRDPHGLSRLEGLRTILWLLLSMVVIATLLAACATRAPQRLPWEPPLDLTQPAERASVRQMVRLRDNPAQCRALVEAAGARVSAVPPLAQGACGHRDALRFRDGRLGSAQLTGNADLPLACPVAAALLLWERDVVQPAAQRQLGSRVTRIEHYGSYACRNIYGTPQGNLSEHARANAIDIAAFRTADGRRITVLQGWNADPASRAFLREVRDGACRLFATTLSPDYNQAHADHFHFDQADRGFWSGAFCR